MSFLFFCRRIPTKLCSFRAHGFGLCWSLDLDALPSLSVPLCLTPSLSLWDLPHSSPPHASPFSVSLLWVPCIEDLKEILTEEHSKVRSQTKMQAFLTRWLRTNYLKALRVWGRVFFAGIYWGHEDSPLGWHMLSPLPQAKRERL